MRLLVADDSNSFLAIFDAYKKRIHKEIDFYLCNSFKDVLDLENKEFDIGIIDLHIGLKTGFDIIRITSIKKIYMISAWHSKESQELCRKIGVTPLDKEDIINISQFKRIVEGKL